MNWFYYAARYIMLFLLALLTRWSVEGRENVPSEGPLLIVANHLHNADPPLLGVCIQRKIMFMAKEELFRNRFSRYFVTGYGAFPVNRGRLTRSALARTEELLGQGYAVVMFPEGRRSKRAKLIEALPGTALVAIKSQAPILPIGITGTEKIAGAFWWLKRPRIRVVIGIPFHLPPLNGKVSKEELTALTDYIMSHIAALLPKEYRGHYGSKQSTQG